jgi:hypothetical protein
MPPPSPLATLPQRGEGRQATLVNSLSIGERGPRPLNPLSPRPQGEEGGVIFSIYSPLSPLGERVSRSDRDG